MTRSTIGATHSLKPTTPNKITAAVSRAPTTFVWFCVLAPGRARHPETGLRDEAEPRVLRDDLLGTARLARDLGAHVEARGAHDRDEADR